jgi:aspartokinase-like uncharacterized kinase
VKIVKIGGSLLPYATEIMPEFKDQKILLIPGGGIFADIVRYVHDKYPISEEAAHIMAILATHQYGHLLSDISGIPTINNLDDFKERAILLPLKTMSESKLESSWNVTSDTIACYAAKILGEKEFIKLTDVDGIILNDRTIRIISAGKLLNTNTCLDKSLPSYLRAWKMDCRIINGKRKSDIKRVLEGEPIGTLVIGGT